MKPLGDFAMILLDSDEYGFAGDNQDTAESGILIKLPDRFNYYGFYSFAFENSFMNREELTKLYEYWKTRIGKRVFWMALSEKGSIISKDGKRYAFVKFSSLICEDDADSTAVNILKSGEGSFKA